MPDRRAILPAAGIAVLALAAHAATLGRYGFYRDELYFIACFKRLTWGFVDQPPLIPVLSGFALAFGGSLFALRVFAAIAAAAAVFVAALTARELGGGRFAMTLTAICVALMPGSLFLGNTLTTTSFEPLTWTLALWLTLRLAHRSNLFLTSMLALDVAVASYMKYSIFLLIAAVLAALLLQSGGHKTAMRVGWSALVAVALLGPNIAWQAEHGLPMLAVLHGDVVGRHAFHAGPQYEFSAPLLNAPIFAIEQLAFANPLASPVWLYGLIAILRRRLGAAARFIGVAYIILLFFALASNAKGYYVIGIYPALFAAGSCAFEAAPGRLRTSIAVVALASGLILLPLTLPVLPANGLIRYMTLLEITGRNGSQPHLMQPLFADEFGWQRLTATVAGYYSALPPQRRVDTPIYSDTYGIAAALAYYGPAYGLPEPISAQNQYYLWGPHGYSGRTMLAVGASQYRLLRRVFRSVVQIGTFTDPYRWVIEGPTPIYLCTDPVAPLTKLWPRLRWYGA